MPPIGLTLLLHDLIDPVSGPFVLFAVLGILGGGASAMWRRVEVAYGGEGVVVAVFVGTVLLTIAADLFNGPIFARYTALPVLGALGGSALVVHRRSVRHLEGGSRRWLWGAAGCIAGVLAGIAANQLIEVMFG